MVARFAAVSLLALCACDAESQVAPRVPVNAQVVDHTQLKGPDIRDSVPQLASPVVHPALGPAPEPPPPRRTVSLGFIGDEPVGMHSPPPYPKWARPFPCHWTHTCFVAPPVQIIPPPRWDGQAP